MSSAHSNHVSSLSSNVELAALSMTKPQDSGKHFPRLGRQPEQPSPLQFPDSLREPLKPAHFPSHNFTRQGSDQARAESTTAHSWTVNERPETPSTTRAAESPESRRITPNVSSPQADSAFPRIPFESPAMIPDRRESGRDRSSCEALTKTGLDAIIQAQGNDPIQGCAQSARSNNTAPAPSGDQPASSPAGSPSELPLVSHSSPIASVPWVSPTVALRPPRGTPFTGQEDLWSEEAFLKCLKLYDDMQDYIREQKSRAFPDTAPSVLAHDPGVQWPSLSASGDDISHRGEPQSEQTGGDPVSDRSVADVTQAQYPIDVRRDLDMAEHIEATCVLPESPNSAPLRPRRTTPAPFSAHPPKISESPTIFNKHSAIKPEGGVAKGDRSIRTPIATSRQSSRPNISEEPAENNGLSGPPWHMLEEAISRVDATLRIYGASGSVASFNGGKDATIVLYLYVASLANYYRHTPPSQRFKPKATYFFSAHSEFAEVVDFVEGQERKLDLNLGVYLGSFRERVEDCLRGICSAVLSPLPGDWRIHPAFLLGVRRGDPRSEGLESFEPFSAWVPTKIPFMRVHPIIRWTYGTVWQFIKTFHIPYCPLYDRGYSSLGTVQNTQPNAKLISPLGARPASELSHWTSERSGRDVLPEQQSPDDLRAE